MNFVEPIRDRKKIAQIKNQLRGQRRYRDLLLFVVGINTALRISDLLELQIQHFLDDHQRIKQRCSCAAWTDYQRRFPLVALDHGLCCATGTLCQSTARSLPQAHSETTWQEDSTGSFGTPDVEHHLLHVASKYALPGTPTGLIGLARFFN